MLHLIHKRTWPKISVISFPTIFSEGTIESPRNRFGDLNFWEFNIFRNEEETLLETWAKIVV